MNCPQLLKVSMLLDGELSPSQEARIRSHLTECQECSQAWEGFAALQRQMRSAAADASGNVQHALERILDPPRSGFWQRRISVPAPLAAAAALLLAALSIWAGTMQFEQSAKSQPASFEASSASLGSGIDLARFDQGQSALIYKRPKPQGREQ